MYSWLKWGFGLGLLWYGVLRGAEAVQVKVHSYSFRNISLADGTASLNLNLQIKNPLLVGVTINGVQGNVFMQGEQVGTINTTYDYYIAGGKTHILPVVVNLTLSQLGKAVLMNIESGDVRTLTVGFDGKLLFGKVSIPLKLNLDYNDLTQ